MFVSVYVFGRDNSALSIVSFAIIAIGVFGFEAWKGVDESRQEETRRRDSNDEASRILSDMTVSRESEGSEASEEEKEPQSALV